MSASAVQAKISPRRSAKRAQLRYVDDLAPGICRVRHGDGFRYVDPAGHALRSAATVRRIRSLAIPPAWERVWICPDPKGHLQATGRDARGRKQYRYHAEFRAEREAEKFDNLLTVAKALPRLRASVERHLTEKKLSRKRILACLVRLLDQTGMRIGSEEYARDNGSYGLTSLLPKHAHFHGTAVLLSYRAKSGVARKVEIDDPRVVRIMKRCHGLASEKLFAWVDDEGEHRPVHAHDVNAYLRRATGENLTAKDFRTWLATVLMVETLLAGEAGAPIKAALETVAKRLGHTPTVCKKSYVHPIVIEHHRSGTLPACSTAKSEALTRAIAEDIVIGLLEGTLPPKRVSGRRRAGAPVATKIAA